MPSRYVDQARSYIRHGARILSLLGIIDIDIVGIVGIVEPPVKPPWHRTPTSTIKVYNSDCRGFRLWSLLIDQTHNRGVNYFTGDGRGSMGNGIDSGALSLADLGDDNADKRRAKQQKVATSNESQSNRVVTKEHTTPERSRTRKARNISDVAVSLPWVCHLVNYFTCVMPQILTFFNLL